MCMHRLFLCLERKQQKTDEPFALFTNCSFPQNVEGLDMFQKLLHGQQGEQCIGCKALGYLNMITKMLRHPAHVTFKKRLKQ